jgi:hypothetical protein
VLVAAIRVRIAIANDLLPIVQQQRLPGFAHPPMLFHWCDEWNDMPAADLLDVCAEIDGLIVRLANYR